MKPAREVVITGMGCLCPLGRTPAALWEAVANKASAIRPLKGFSPDAYRTKLGAEIHRADLDATRQKTGRTLDLLVDMAVWSSAQALSAAQLLDAQERCLLPQTAVVFGTGAGPTQSLKTAYQGFLEKGPRGVRPTTLPRCMANTLSAHLSIRFGLQGPNYVVVSACASATCALGTAWRMIRDGYAERVLCGGSETNLEPATFASWDNLGVMTRNPDPATAVRPFDQKRDGCLLGDGAGALVLESRQSARQRGVTILAELAGYGESSDASHLTRPESRGQVQAMRMALRAADVAPGALGYIHAHGTATPVNDAVESVSIREVLGPAAVSQVPVSSTKSFTGHLLGASGAVETILCIEALRQQKTPPSLNLEDPDPECALHFCPERPMPLARPLIMKNSFGFGGHNAVLVLKG